MATITQVKNNLTMTRGDTITYSFHFKDSVGADINITAWHVNLMVKRAYTDNDVDALISKEVSVHTDPTHGQTVLTINPADTTGVDYGDYVYDFRIRNVTVIYTIMKGKFTIEPEVNKAV